MRKDQTKLACKARGAEVFDNFISGIRMLPVHIWNSHPPRLVPPR
jgi:hypothetical protein